MIVLTLDAQNNRIVIENNELEPEDKPMFVTSSRDFYSSWQLSNDDDPFTLVVNNVDFEGLVFRLIDKNGQQWSTEIIGMTVTGQY